MPNELMVTEEEKIALAKEFATLASINVEQAMGYLEATDFNVDLAFDMFCGDSEDEPVPVQKEYKQEPSHYKPEKRANIFTMQDLVHSDSSDDEVQRKTENTFVGGGGKGGSHLEVVGPNDKKINTAKVFETAKKSALKVIEASEYEKQKHTTPVSNRPSGEDGAESSQNNDMLNIDLYSNGFLANGELFFDIEEPNTKNYINSISQGLIPPDLQAKLKCKSPKVYLTLNDRGEETYIPPPKPYNPFSGTYRILGSPCPTIVTNDQRAQEKILVVNVNLPTAELQYRLGDGNRRTVTVNPSVHTTADLYTHIGSQTPGHNFTLLSGYPNKPVPCNDELIKNTDLQSNIILQRFI